MTWNWQQADWPHFTWNRARLSQAEAQFLIRSGVFVGTMVHLSGTDRDQLTVEAMSSEAMTTSEIEGDILSRESVQSSIRRQLGLAADNRRVPAAEQGISEMMVDLFRHYAKPLDHATLHAWNRMVCRGQTRLTDVGRYRTHTEPMQVDEPKVHFEAPPSERVPAEMDRFVAWFNRTGPGGPEHLHPLTRAGLAHLYFESIHPFEDGNGRIGRAISEKALAQSLGRPSFTALAATIMGTRSTYYAALESASRQNEATHWLAWFAGIILEAQQRTLGRVQFLIDKTKLLDRLRGTLNERQEKVLLRVLREGPEGFVGGLSAANYMSISRASPATARRDLAELVGLRAFTRTGQRKHTRYQLALTSQSVPAVLIGEDGNVGWLRAKS